MCPDADRRSPTTVPDRGESTSAASSDGSDPPPAAAAAEVSEAGRLGRFQVVSELARGGMGRVLLAEDAVLRREVVIKQPLTLGPRALGRFEREALLTARLEHPGIVSVHELLHTAAGEPYLVMRRVRGERFAQVLERLRTIEERLSLLPAFIALAETVAYAHDRGVIHRDLKPDNVLVGAFGETVVIDWGIAKELRESEEPVELVEPIEPGDALLTRPGAVIGTPAYMSPEQARGEPVDRRTDVYALGAMLYQLLAGALPHPESDGKAAMAAVVRGPPRPLSEVAPQSPPELFSVVARAMARSTAERYADAKELADELRAFQTGRLVAAHSYSFRQLLWRWVRRNAALLAIAGASLAVLSVGGAIAIRDVVAARRQADREAQVAERTARFMTGLFRINDPSEARGQSITAREVLDRGAQQIDGLARDPLVQAQLLDSMGTAYASLGLYPRGEELLRQAIRIRKERLGLAAETLQSETTLAQLLKRRGRFAEGEALVREVVAQRQRALGPEHADTLTALFDLSDLLKRQGKNQEATALREQVLAARERVLGPDHPDTLLSLSNLAVVQYEEGRFADAEATARKVLEARTRVLGPDHPKTLESMNVLGDALREQKKLDEALAVYDQVLATRRRVLGPEHPDTGLSMLVEAEVYKKQKRYDKAAEFFQQGLALWRKALGPDHPDVLWATTSYAVLLTRQGNVDQSRAVSEEVAKSVARAHAGESGPAIGAILYNLGWNAALAGDKARAIAWMRQGVDRGLERGTARSIAGDPELAYLKGTPGFAELLSAVTAKFP